MEYLTSAANALLGSDRTEQELCIPLTPKKGSRPVFAELTNMVNISPDKYHNSPLQALFTAPTINTAKAKAPGFSILTPGSKKFNGINVKFHTSPSPSSDSLCRTPKRESFSPRAVGGCLTPKNNGDSPRVISGIKSDSSGRSPFTPMTNLKLLTRVASMEESLSSKKVLFKTDNVANQENENPVAVLEKPSNKVLSTTHNSSTASNLRRHRSENGSTRGGRSRGVIRGGSTLRKHPTGLEYPTPSSPGNLVIGKIGYIPSVDESNNVTKPTEVSRKDKSLGLLSEKFLEHFPLKVSFIETPRRLVIDEVATVLGTERRRVYDIINVLESLSMASRVQKNMYQWMGSLHLEETLGRLKAMAIKMDIGSQLQALQHSDHDFKFPQRIKSSLHFSSGKDGDKQDNRREKSLGILCQKFLMLLLVSPEPHIISMDSAVKMLLVGNEAGDDGDKLRARGRRLYDIANVLTSLHLVKRVPTAKAFQYTGPPIEPIYIEEGDGYGFGVLHRHSLLPSRSSSTDNGRKNLSAGSFGDSEVTPSDNVPPPQQKRGRPRKLSTDFTATLPASKRPRIQRARSEDVLPSKECNNGLSRTPSLHDICQVAEVERERLLETERSVTRALSAESYHQCPAGLPIFSPCETQNTKGPSSAPPSVQTKSISSITNKVSILQRRLTKSKVPVALTFQSPPPEKQAQQTDPLSVSKPKSLQGVFQPIRVLQMQSNGGIVSQSSGSVSIKSPVPTSSHLQVANISSLHRHHSDPLTQTVKLPKGTILSQPFGSQSSSVWQQTGGKISNANFSSGQMMFRNGGNAGGTYVPGNLVSRVVSVKTQSSSGSNSSSNSKVIKVITRTTGGVTSPNDAGSTVITVLPATATAADGSISASHRNSQPEVQPQLLYQPSYVLDTSNNCFTQIQSTARSSAAAQLNQVSTRPSQLSPRVIVSSSSAVAYQRSASLDSHVPFFSQGPHGVPHNSAVPLNIPLASPILGSAIVSPSPLWQPSPDSSSTDSELESIFGDSFSFTRPKSLVRRTSLVSSQTPAKVCR